MQSFQNKHLRIGFSDEISQATRMVTLSSESDLGEYRELEKKQTSSEISSARSIQIRVSIVLNLSAAKSHVEFASKIKTRHLSEVGLLIKFTNKICIIETRIRIQLNERSILSLCI